MAKDQNKSNAGSVIGAAVIGAAVGAASIALMDKKTRDRVGKKVSKSLDEGERRITELMGTAHEVGEDDASKKALPKVEKAKREIKKS